MSHSDRNRHYKSSRMLQRFNRMIQVLPGKLLQNRNQAKGTRLFKRNLRKNFDKTRLRRTWQRTQHPDDRLNFNRATREPKDILPKGKIIYVSGICSRIISNC